MLFVWVAHPLPLKVHPIHRQLLAQCRLTFGQLGLSILAAIEVVRERVERAFRERAGELEPRAARRWFAFVDRREMCGANRLRRKRRESKEQHPRAGEQTLPT